MALPPGFNPNEMSFKNITKAKPVIEIPRNSYARTSYRPSWWSRFNSGVASVGNWFAENVNMALVICNVIFIAVAVIIAIGYVVDAWIDDGFWMALLVAVIAYFVVVISWGLGYWVIEIVVNVLMYGLRLLLWNGWTFLVSLALALLIGAYAWKAKSLDRTTYQQHSPTEYVATLSQTYVCTARSSLNVRNSPNTSSKTIGNLRYGEEVEVYEIINGFARIKYQGQDGYASTKYLRKK